MSNQEKVTVCFEFPAYTPFGLLESFGGRIINYKGRVWIFKTVFEEPNYGHNCFVLYADFGGWVNPTYCVHGVSDKFAFEMFDNLPVGIKPLLVVSKDSLHKKDKKYLIVLENDHLSNHHFILPDDD